MIIFIMTLMGYPATSAYDTPSTPKCIIDMCEEKLCTVETPEGIVHIEKKPHYEEGMPITCPLWLVEPT
jgi:hypothetical protein